MKSKQIFQKLKIEIILLILDSYWCSLSVCMLGNKLSKTFHLQCCKKFCGDSLCILLIYHQFGFSISFLFLCLCLSATNESLYKFYEGFSFSAVSTFDMEMFVVIIARFWMPHSLILLVNSFVYLFLSHNNYEKYSILRPFSWIVCTWMKKTRNSNSRNLNSFINVVNCQKLSQSKLRFPDGSKSTYSFFSNICWSRSLCYAFSHIQSQAHPQNSSKPLHKIIFWFARNSWNFIEKMVSLQLVPILTRLNQISYDIFQRLYEQSEYKTFQKAPNHVILIIRINQFLLCQVR